MSLAEIKNNLRRQSIENYLRRGGILLTPQRIDSLNLVVLDSTDWITFSYDLGVPFQLELYLDSYEWPPEEKKRLLQVLINPQTLVPLYRFQLARRVITDPWKDSVLWTKGIGIEGHFIGLKQEEILRKLRYYEYLIEGLVRDHDQRLQDYPHLRKAERFMPVLNQFIHNPALPISPYFAFFMYEVFGLILQDARQTRDELQKAGVKANIDYQQNIRQAAKAKRLSEPILILKEGKVINGQLMGGEVVIGFPPPPQDPDSNGPKTDSRRYFPCLTEVGRFAHPILGILMRLSDSLSLPDYPDYHQPSLLAAIRLKKEFERK